MAWVYNHFVIFFPAVLCARINITTQPIRYFTTVWIPPVRKQLLQLTVTFGWKRRSAPLLPANKRKPTRRKEMTSCPNKECRMHATSGAKRILAPNCLDLLLENTILQNTHILQNSLQQYLIGRLTPLNRHLELQTHPLSPHIQIRAE